ncbi:MAG: aminopeptidase P family N-terminal domain-containing protein [Clostridiales bacterium]|nr:aminopeptidase P family N-terminal domain-containing protein [Candidatus Crickella equi]
MEIKDRVVCLRSKMLEKGIDVYVVPTADFHQSEYVGAHFKTIEYITGFTGEGGIAVFTKDEARLWVDGRFFIQGEIQLKGTTVELMKIGEPGVPAMVDYLEGILQPGMVLGFDGRTVSVGEGQEYADIASRKDAKVVYSEDLIDEIWTDRPSLSTEPAFLLDVKYSGETTESKLSRVREEMKKVGADAHILTTLDDLGWLFNFRGNDIDFFPMVLGYAIVKMDKVELYADENKFDADMKKTLAADGVVFHPYNDIYKDVCNLGGVSVMIDYGKLNYAMYNNIPATAKLIKARNPEILMKAIKNDVELANIKVAQIKDSIAHVKFMKWVKENYNKIEISEMSAMDKLEELRIEQGNYIRQSFAPISSYGEHAAIVHYSSSPETDVVIKEGNFFLTDTGAGFYEGSTDITRTYALGEVSQIMKDHFTLVAISNLSLANVKFMEGANGMNLDLLARKPFWDRNMNFNHGTGHGVGYLLNIHEAPSGFRWQHRSHEVEPFHENMIITDEPGIYIEGSHGVRLENEILCCKGERNEYGQFMYFEPITFIPFDLDAINPDIMTAEDKKMLNDYHKSVYEKLAPHLDEEERVFLEKYTRAI